MFIIAFCLTSYHFRFHDMLLSPWVQLIRTYQKISLQIHMAKEAMGCSLVGAMIINHIRRTAYRLLSMLRFGLCLL